MKFGLVGGGRWAAVHAAALREAGGELTAVLVATEASVRRIREEWGVMATTDWDEFLSDSAPYAFEAAIIASPNYLHAEHAKRCLLAARHVLVEKPFALNVQDAASVMKLAEEAGLVAAAGHSMRRFTLFEAVKDLITEGAVGTPLHLRIDLWRRPYRAGAGAWKSDPAKVGSSILEEPIHYLDLARYYLVGHHGEPRDVQAWANSLAGGLGWENLDVMLDFGEARALLTRSLAGWGHQIHLQLVGSEGALQAAWSGEMDVDSEPSQRLELKRGHAIDAPREVVSVPLGGHAFDIPKQTETFIRAIREGAPPAASARDGLEAVRLSRLVEEAL